MGMTKLFRVTLAICLTLDISIIIIILSLKDHLPPIVPLFYGLPVSSNILIANIGLLIPPLTASFLSLINLTIVKITKDSFLEKILAGLTITITILSAITVIKIIFLVGSI